MNRMIETAFDNSSHEGDALALFAADGGIVHDDEHRETLVSDIEACMDGAETDMSWIKALSAVRDLTTLGDYIKMADLGTRLERL